MKSFLQFLKESNDRYLVESGAKGHLQHLFEDGELKFSDLRTIFTNLFTGKLNVTEKIDGMNLAVTYKDGKVLAARSASNIKNPIDIDQLGKKFEGKGEVKTAFVNSMSDISEAINMLTDSEKEKVFKNGQNFLSFEVVAPECQNVIDYGDRCLMVLHSLDQYDDSYNLVQQEKVGDKNNSELVSVVYDLFKDHDALKQNKFEISKPVVLKIKNSSTAKECLNEVLQELDSLCDGIGYKSTINDYCKERYEKKIINAAKRSNLDLSRNSQFVSELADRLNTVSSKKPTKADLVTFARRDGLNTNSQEYKDFIKAMESTMYEDNAEIIRPVENLVIKAGMKLIENMSGYLTVDNSINAKKLKARLDETLKELEDNENELPENKYKIMQKNIKKLADAGKDVSGVEGLVFTYKGHPFKLTGTFGSINALQNLLKY